MFGIPRLYAFIGGGILALALIVGLKIHLDNDARIRDRLNSVRIVLADVGFEKPKAGHEAADVKALAAERDKYLAERNTARTLVDVQSHSIEALGEERDRALQEAAANRRLVAATIKERNAWIARAKVAETRTERLSAEQEVAECEAVLDDLYAKGF